MKSDGSCCDPSQLDRDDYTPSGCNVDCDNRFIFCGANLGAKDSTDCNLGLVRTGYVGGDVIVAPFEEKNGNSNSNFGNVVELRGKTWRVSMYSRCSNASYKGCLSSCLQYHCSLSLPSRFYKVILVTELCKKC